MVGAALRDDLVSFFFEMRDSADCTYVVRRPECCTRVMLSSSVRGRYDGGWGTAVARSRDSVSKRGMSAPALREHLR